MSGCLHMELLGPLDQGGRTTISRLGHQKWLVRANAARSLPNYQKQHVQFLRTSQSSFSIHRYLKGADGIRCQALVEQTAPPVGPQEQPSLLDESVPRGDTAGAVLLLQGVTVQAGERDLLQEADWQLMPGDKVGLVGANGAGKSTLLRCITGRRGINAGRLLVGQRVQLGYLEQTAVSGSNRTVWEEARSRMLDVLQAEADMQAASEAATRGEKGAAASMQEALDAFEAAGGHEVDKRIANVLNGLGFLQDHWHKPCSEFSGGWQMRIALARLLLGPGGQGASLSNARPGLLLLDEPSNHLDAAATAWLGNYLRGCPAGVVIVSHDQALLESACQRVVEIRGRSLHHYVGSYSEFLVQREARQAAAQAAAERQAQEVAHLQSFVDRFGAKATKASQAQSRLKALDKLKQNAVQAPTPLASVSAPGDARKVRLKLPVPPPCQQEVLTVQNLSVGWEGGPVLLRHVSFMLERGERILLLGPNGAGKSSLLKTLAGELAQREGTVQEGRGVRKAVFSQDLAQDLPLEQAALDYVLEKARALDPLVPLEAGRAVLGALGLVDDTPLRPIGELSGGEKARVALAAFALVPYNLLLLDEASNHLDAGTIQALTDALKDFKGAILAITHNQAFAESLRANRVFRVRDGQLRIADNPALFPSDFQLHDPASPPQASGNTAKVGGPAGKGEGMPSPNGWGKGGQGRGKPRKGSGSRPDTDLVSAPEHMSPFAKALGSLVEKRPPDDGDASSPQSPVARPERSRLSKNALGGKGRIRRQRVHPKVSLRA
eukprot:jgi/Botrbrau1/1249/Bobra.0163s0042.1